MPELVWAIAARARIFTGFYFVWNSGRQSLSPASFRRALVLHNRRWCSLGSMFSLRFWRNNWRTGNNRQSCKFAELSWATAQLFRKSSQFSSAQAWLSLAQIFRKSTQLSSAFSNELSAQLSSSSAQLSSAQLKLSFFERAPSSAQLKLGSA